MPFERLRELFFTGAFGTALLLAGANSANAGPIGDTACTNPANAFGTQVNCGTYIDTISPGNDGGGPLVVGGTNYSQIAKWEGSWTGTAGFTITGLPSGFATDNGTWTSPFSVMFMVVKASNEYSVYGQGSLSSGSIGTVNNSLVDVTALFTGSTSGFWATAPTLLGGNNAGRNISHLSFYGRGDDDSTQFPVPEPGALSLLGLGLLGLGLSRRRNLR